MRIGFKKKQFDERITNLQNKIYRELYIFVVIICVLSLGYKHFTGNATFENIITEIIILLGGGIYYLIRSSQLGIFSDEVEMHDRSSKINLDMKNFLISMVLGVGISLTFAIVNSQRYADNQQEEIYFFFTILLVSLMIYIPLLTGIMVLPYIIAKYKSNRVNDRELEDPDDEDER